MQNCTKSVSPAPSSALVSALLPPHPRAETREISWPHALPSYERGRPFRKPSLCRGFLRAKTSRCENCDQGERDCTPGNTRAFLVYAARPLDVPFCMVRNAKAADLCVTGAQTHTRNQDRSCSLDHPGEGMREQLKLGSFLEYRREKDIVILDFARFAVEVSRVDAVALAYCLSELVDPPVKPQLVE